MLDCIICACGLPWGPCRRDVLIVSGDVSESLPALEEALTVLTARFGAVFYTPGNHELWVRERDRCACFPVLRTCPTTETCRLSAYAGPPVGSAYRAAEVGCVGFVSARHAASNFTGPKQQIVVPTLGWFLRRAAGVHDSLTKLRLIWEACARLGVHTRPRCLGGSLWIVPVLRWAPGGGAVGCGRVRVAAGSGVGAAGRWGGRARRQARSSSVLSQPLLPLPLVYAPQRQGSSSDASLAWRLSPSCCQHVPRSFLTSRSNPLPCPSPACVQLAPPQL